MASLQRLLPISLVTTLLFSVAFVVMVYGYPSFFAQVLRSQPDQYQANVLEALEQDDIPLAQKLARKATQVETLDPMAYTLYARTLLASGDTENALLQLDQACSITQTPAPDYLPTHRPFYFAPARLPLGKVHAENGRWMEAVNEFELARAYNDLTTSAFDDFHETLYSTYATLGLWGRALTFRTPSPAELKSLDNSTLIDLAKAGEGLKEWGLLISIGEELRERHTLDPTSAFLLGRAYLARDEFDAAIATLDGALVENHPDAPYYLGLAYREKGLLDKSLIALLHTSNESLYRPFAINAALSIGSLLTPKQQSELRNELEEFFQGHGAVTSIASHAEYRAIIPKAIWFDQEQIASDRTFPVLVLWQQQLSETDSAPNSPGASNNEALLIRDNDHLLQLHWLNNRANWFGIEHTSPESSLRPGWTDIAQEWFDLRAVASTQIVHEDDIKTLEVTNTDIHKYAQLYNVPVEADPGQDFLFLGRLNSPDTPAILGWQALDNQDTIIAERFLFSQEVSPAWTMRATYIPANLTVHRLRVQLGITRHEGTAHYDDIALLPIQRPEVKR